MKIEIVKPHEDYPYAKAHVGIAVDTDSAELSDILAKSRITLLGPWDTYRDNGLVKGFVAPVLLEDEHVKPRKTTRARKK